MALQIPIFEGEWVSWFQQFLPAWARWNEEVESERLRTTDKLREYSIGFTLLNGTQINALQNKDVTHLYACLSDPSGGAGGSGFYRWTGASWVKFA